MDGLIAYVQSKKHTDSAIQEILDAGFKVQVEQDRSILSRTGQQMTLYLIPKESSLSTDTYDEYVYTSKWEQIGSTDIDLNYEDLENKPSINGVELSGNKTSDELGLQKKLTAGTNISISDNGTISARTPSYDDLANKPRISAYKIGDINSSFNNLKGILGFKHLDFEYFGTEGNIEIKLTDKIFESDTNTLIGWAYDFNTFASSYAIAGVFFVMNSRISNLPSAFTYFDTSSSAQSYVFHYFDPTIQNGVTVPIIRQVIYLDTNGDTRNFIQLANATKNSNGSYSVSNANGWLELSYNGSQIVSGAVDANGHITFTNSDGNTFTTTGASVIGPQGNDYVLTAQDKTDIANIVLGELPTTEGVLYGNASN